MRGELGRSLVRVMDYFSRVNSLNRQSYPPPPPPPPPPPHPPTPPPPFFTQSEVLREVECWLFFLMLFCCVGKDAGWESKCYSLDSGEGGMQENSPTWDVISFSFFFWFVSLCLGAWGLCITWVRHCTQFAGRWYREANWFSRIDSTVIKSGPFSPPPPKINNNNNKE